MGAQSNFKPLKISILLYLSLLLSCSSSSFKEAVVSKVIDGDTIELSNGERVRYIGMDTPESHQKKGSEWVYAPQQYAQAAKEFNEKLVLGKKVKLEFDVEKRDRYGRLLAYVYVDRVMANAEILKCGYGFLYTYPPNVKYVELFVKLQKEARENNRGLWKNNLISHQEAQAYIGKVRMVQGKVINTFETEKVIFLNFGEDYKNDFTIVIFKKDKRNFLKKHISPATYYRGKKVRVLGKIKEYNGPEIIVSHPAQIEVDKELLTIVHLTDLHYTSTPPKETLLPWKYHIRLLGYKLHKLNLAQCHHILEKTIEYINQKISPDLVLLTGDIVDRGEDLKGMLRVKEILNRLNCPWYAVMGDHDFNAGEDRRKNYGYVFGKIN